MRPERAYWHAVHALLFPWRLTWLILAVLSMVFGAALLVYTERAMAFWLALGPVLIGILAKALRRRHEIGYAAALLRMPQADERFFRALWGSFGLCLGTVLLIGGLWAREFPVMQALIVTLLVIGIAHCLHFLAWMFVIHALSVILGPTLLQHIGLRGSDLIESSGFWLTLGSALTIFGIVDDRLLRKRARESIAANGRGQPQSGDADPFRDTTGQHADHFLDEEIQKSSGTAEFLLTLLLPRRKTQTMMAFGSALLLLIVCALFFHRGHTDNALVSIMFGLIGAPLLISFQGLNWREPVHDRRVLVRWLYLLPGMPRGRPLKRLLARRFIRDLIATGCLVQPVFITALGLFGATGMLDSWWVLAPIWLFVNLGALAVAIFSLLLGVALRMQSSWAWLWSLFGVLALGCTIGMGLGQIPACWFWPSAAGLFTLLLGYCALRMPEGLIGYLDRRLGRDTGP